MNDDLRALIDERDVSGVVYDLFVKTDRRDWPGVAACFEDSVLFDMASLTGVPPAALSPDQITAGWSAGLAKLEAVHHQAGNLRVRVRGDEAEAFCYGIAYHYRKTKSGRNTRTFVGSYDFGLRRSESRWKIHRFRFNVQFVDGNLELDADT